MWAVFSLHVEAIFSVCCGGIFGLSPPLPRQIFGGSPIIVVTFFSLNRYLSFSRSWRFQVFEETHFFLFLRGGGLRVGGRLLSTFRLSQGACRAGVGGYRIIIVM